MRIVRDQTAQAPQDRGASVAIGNFDGVHLGHRAVIDLARDTAWRLAAPLGVLTFEPHPREYFAPDAPPFRLMNAEARAHRLEKLGVDILYELPFDGAMASLTPRDFAAHIIRDGFGLTHVTVGDDFRFGAKRAGHAADLTGFGAEMGFGATLAPLMETGGMEISSTRIRQALTDGDPHGAAAMLGHLHRIEGPVLHGEKRGRTLNYPTANQSIAGLHPPAFGVYAVRADILTGRHRGSHPGVASLGVRPMFGVNAANLETHIFDFTGDLYGEHLSVALIDYLRPEATFDTLDALIAQMDADSVRARSLLGHALP